MKKILTITAAALWVSAAYSQSAIDAYRLSQPDLKGTARYMSMGGAFGALGGDLSVLSHNPGGIGVYRNSDIGFTVDLDLQKSNSATNMGSFATNQTKFLLNNIGVVWTLKLPNASCPNLNFGFTYNKDVSFNRRYQGRIGLTNSLSNYIAAITTAGGYNTDQLLGSGNFDPYNPIGGYEIPWLSILGYDGYLISETSPKKYEGQWGSDTNGVGYFDVQESGGIDSYNIALGGNISNIVFWGMDFDITHMNYNLNPIWSENLENARIGDDNGQFSTMSSRWSLSNLYNCTGTGFNYKLGFIVKPIQEFRIGFAFETPTWYSLTETFAGELNAIYGNTDKISVSTNGGWPGYTNVDFRTPWKLNISAAAVLFNRLIISAEYEWTQYKKMRYSSPSYWGGGDYWDDDFYPDYPWDYPGDYPWDYPGGPFFSKSTDFDPYVARNSDFYNTNKDINVLYSNTNTLRIGGEFRVIPQLSLRAGYCYVSSPINSKIEKNSMIETAGTIPNYRLDNTTDYITAGLGFRFQKFYVDLAYVYKHMSSEYHAYSPFYQEATENQKADIVQSPTSSVAFNNSQIILSAGFKF